MKKTIIAASLLFASISYAQNSIDSKLSVKNEIDSVSYLLGVAIATNISNDLKEGNTELILKGMRDKLTGNSELISDPTNQVLNSFFQKKQHDKKQQEEQLGQLAKAEGEKFLQENKKNKKVKVTPSGLQYEILKEGKGEKPTETSQVKVHYHGTTIDGKVFDSSVDRGEPIVFGLNQVIKGWTEGVQLMPIG
ncbi:MAG: FKBP-type peptidyl-prolyl cis-trans isomerase, partial [Crocinitomicaceae bacterium]|nr:FKBP-type peptidyl-prolyl cis-trans isomerase [Crocinitomicaceae bacterium]